MVTTENGDGVCGGRGAVMRDAPPENASVHLGNRLSMYRRMDLGSGQKDGSDELSRGGSTCERFSCLPASCHSIRYQNRVSNSQSETADRSRKLIGCTATRLVKSALTADMKCLHSHIYDRTLTQEREGVRHIMACYDMCAVIALQSGWKFSEFLTAGGGRWHDLQHKIQFRLAVRRCISQKSVPDSFRILNFNPKIGQFQLQCYCMHGGQAR